MARMLRRRQTPWEKMLWSVLRGGKTGFHFRRQHPLLGFVLDFYCDEVRLCVEIDGAGHKIWNEERDQARDAQLRDGGILVMRFSNEQIGSDLFGCVEKITIACVNRAGQFSRPHQFHEDQRWREDQTPYENA